ncbi:cytochrome P450 2A9 [Solenopsis invicta]|uniref:cytochrome P450 2A9 n=1 Tax=Solenopsis invicta TaxID=13686 RepID=UPI0005958F86|nr:cytochrome P450 2A9 [Solenopsis invicta]
MLYITVILTLICIIIINFLWNYLFSSRTVKLLPGPSRLPLIGTYAFLQPKPKGLLNFMIQLCENYSSPFQMWISQKLIVTIYDPYQVKEPNTRT